MTDSAGRPPALVFAAPRETWIRPFIGSLAGLLVGVVLAVVEALGGPPVSTPDLLLCFGAFGLCAVVIGLNVFRPRRLEVTAGGIVVTTNLKRYPLLRWEHLQDFDPHPTGRKGGGFTLFRYCGPERDWPGRRVRAMSRSSRCNGSLPGTFGLGPVALFVMLEEARRTHQAVASSGPRSAGGSAPGSAVE